jgi:hypothetical protein
MLLLGILKSTTTPSIADCEWRMFSEISCEWKVHAPRVQQYLRVRFSSMRQKQRLEVQVAGGAWMMSVEMKSGRTCGGLRAWWTFSERFCCLSEGSLQQILLK